ncbi:MAG: tRNA uridine-5-carboxymethylaminomethyl(34) synthesis GTPase MnmE [Prevotella sp.]|nr:tRNA uridine-5-carboxymethylaminomethyl(34) synthesis GTPase MnmE [Prevotella sp.]
MQKSNHIDTICAPATAPGGALGIIRISGPDAISIVASICRDDIRTQAANTLSHTYILNGDEMVDEVMVSVYKAPHSYTGEDSVEISCHGSRYILNRVLTILMEKGCRQANPGEFTQRAFLNGKMDLSQAEAVADLIASTNKATHQLAMSQLRGNISTELSQLRDQLLKMTSLLELELDFSDHEDLEFADRSQLLDIANKIDNHITKLVLSFETGQALKLGIPVAIVGKTNVGKSTLLNRLLKEDRAIVSDIHGTTRDTIEDVIDIRGVQFRFIDTAGIRQATDEVEQIGISRTFQAIHKARIILWLIDQMPSLDDMKEIIKNLAGKSLVIIQNKIDKESIQQIDLSSFPELSGYPFIAISAKHRLHLTELEEIIFEAANLPSFSDTDVIVTNARHYESLIHAQATIRSVILGLQQQLSGDLLSEDLRQTLDHLADITGGQITTNEVLGNIFTHFCIGK